MYSSLISHSVWLFRRGQVAYMCRIRHDGAVSIWLPFILSGAAVAVVLVALLVGRKRSPRLYELGPISAHWLSEHQTHTRDSEGYVVPFIAQGDTKL
jgi:hypothetical protein